MLVLAVFTWNCAETTRAPEDLDVELTPDALSQPQFECESTKRECLIAADCDADKREACESAFRECDEPIRAERDRVREMCRTEREKCEGAAADDAARHACHIAEHKCKLPVDPPEAVCHIDAEECIWAARGGEPKPKMSPESDAERACHETERECKDAKRLDPKDLPKPPHCEPEPPPPPACTPVDPVTPPPPPPATTPAPLSPADSECERTKRECLIAADCDADKREACESAFRTCDEPARAERDRVHEMCRTEREKCEGAAADEAARHACHIAEHKCNLPVEPPDAVCRIDAEECMWAARGMKDTATPPDPMMPPAESDAEKACHDAERECKDAKKVAAPELPKPPHCPKPPPPCKPAAPKS